MPPLLSLASPSLFENGRSLPLLRVLRPRFHPGHEPPETVSSPVGHWWRRRRGRRRWGRRLLLASPSPSSRRSSSRRRQCFPRRSFPSRALRTSSRRSRLLRCLWRRGRRPRPPRRRRGPGGRSSCFGELGAETKLVPLLRDRFESEKRFFFVSFSKKAREKRVHLEILRFFGGTISCASRFSPS
jgi:hypothetical protein